MKNRSLYFLFVALILTSAACRDDDDDAPQLVSETDRVFIVTAADGNLFEINAGQVAASKGGTQQIKDYGQQMTEDHTAASRELMTIAADKRVDIPTTLGTGRQQKLDSLSAVSGTAFDTLYTQMMVSTHIETVRLFESQVASGQDQTLKAWASEKLPVLRAHLSTAEALRDSVRRDM